MIDDAVANHVELAAIMKVLVNGIPAREYNAVEQNHVADLEFPDVGIFQRGRQAYNLRRRQGQVGHFLLVLELMRRLVEPFLNVAVDIQNHSAAPVCPAHIRDRHEKRRRQAIELADFAAPDGEFPGKTHRTDIERVGFLHNAGFEQCELRVGIRVVDVPQELALRELVTRSAVAADRDADESRTAPFALGLPNGVENTGADAFKITVGPLPLDLHRQAVLRTHVLAAATLQDEPDANP